MDRNDYYVQPLPVMDKEGNWQVLAGFGTEDLGLGIKYQAIVFATRDNFFINLFNDFRFRPNQVIQTIPEGVRQLKSVIVCRPLTDELSC